MHSVCTLYVIPHDFLPELTPIVLVELSCIRRILVQSLMPSLSMSQEIMNIPILVGHDTLVWLLDTSVLR